MAHGHWYSGPGDTISFKYWDIVALKGLDDISHDLDRDPVKAIYGMRFDKSKLDDIISYVFRLSGEVAAFEADLRRRAKTIGHSVLDDPNPSDGSVQVTPPN